MRVLYIASGGDSYSDLDPNIVQSLRILESEIDWFGFRVFHPDRDSVAALFAHVRTFRPDVVLSLRGALSAREVLRLRRTGIPVGLFVVDDPYLLRLHSRQVVPYDFMVTQESSCVPYYRKRRKPCFHLPLGVNEQTYRPLPVPPRYRSDICFVGSALPARLQAIDGMAGFLCGKKFLLIGRWWERLHHYHRLRHGILNRTVPPAETAKYYNGAEIVLNIHRTKNDVNGNPFGLPAFTPNNRTFDIAACRSFQLVTHRRELGRYYRIGEEIVSYRGIPDLKRKIHFHLTHEEQRKRLAAKAYARTLRQHTYTVRLRGFLHRLRAWLGARVRDGSGGSDLTEN